MLKEKENDKEENWDVLRPGAVEQSPLHLCLKGAIAEIVWTRKWNVRLLYMSYEAVYFLAPHLLCL